MDKETVTIRIKAENQKPLWDAINRKKKEENRASVSNTLEAALLEYFKIKKKN